MGKQLARNDSSVRTEAKKSISLPYTERRPKQRNPELKRKRESCAVGRWSSVAVRLRGRARSSRTAETAGVQLPGRPKGLVTNNLPIVLPGWARDPPAPQGRAYLMEGPHGT